MVILPLRLIKAVFKSKTILPRRYLSALLHSKRLVNFKGRDCVSRVLQCLAGIHERVDNSCKQIAEYLLSLFRHCPHRAWSVKGEVCIPCGG